MRKVPFLYIGAIAVALLLSFALSNPAASETAAQRQDNVAPNFNVDPFWPKPLPNDWLLGQVAGIDVDTQDVIWIVQRPGSLTNDERGLELGRSMCCLPAPPVISFDTDGNLLDAWGGPAACTPEPGVNPVVGGDCYEWPVNEHGIYVDDMGNVWLAGNGGNDHQVLKFSQDGTFLLQIGRAGVTGGDADPMHLGRPAEMAVDIEANEVYIADGYANHRVIVFDATTGEFKRMWGAYGLPPDDQGDNGFGNPVHCAVITDEGLVYVCDRVKNRVQIFEKDGTFVREFYIRQETLGNGSTWDLAFSADKRQSYVYDADGENNVVWTLRRETDEILGYFGRSGRQAGQFHWVHNLDTDSKGNLYTAEVDTGKRAQKFVATGFRPTD
ncbi:MAG: hypothetical protein RRC07_16750 [Anaerolineae bacterium]|nr:hypothetical protein [Anaerolineae bacterium]